MSKKILLKDRNPYTKKNNVCISNALFNIYKPVKLYINNSVRKETISHLTMDLNLNFYAIAYVSTRFKNIDKMLVTIGNGQFSFGLPFSQFYFNNFKIFKNENRLALQL